MKIRIYPPRSLSIQFSAPNGSLEAPSIKSRSESFLFSLPKRIHFICPIHSATTIIKGSFQKTASHDKAEFIVIVFQSGAGLFSYFCNNKIITVIIMPLKHKAAT